MLVRCFFGPFLFENVDFRRKMSEKHSATIVFDVVFSFSDYLNPDKKVCKKVSFFFVLTFGHKKLFNIDIPETALSDYIDDHFTWHRRFFLTRWKVIKITIWFTKAFREPTTVQQKIEKIFSLLYICGVDVSMCVLYMWWCVNWDVLDIVWLCVFWTCNDVGVI